MEGLFEKVKAQNNKYHNLMYGDFVKSNIPHSVLAKKESCSKKFKNEQLYLFNKLDSKVQNTYDKNETIRPLTIEKINLYEFSVAYLRFHNCVDLSNENKKTIIKFKLEIFRKVLSSEYNDADLNIFIKKLCDDPIFYEKNEKPKFYEILKFSYFYCMKNNKQLFLKHIKQKLIKNKSLDEIRISNFPFFITNDSFIDLLALKSGIKMCFVAECQFLNAYYKKYLTKNRNDLEIEIFVKRIIESLKILKHTKHISFLKEVFTRGSVLTNLIDDNEIIKLVFNLMKTIKNYNDKHFSLIYSIANIFYESHSFEILNFINSEIKAFNIPKNKQIKNILIFEVRSIKNLDQLFDLILENKENYKNFEIIVHEYLQIAEVVEIMNVDFLLLVELIDFNIQVIKNLKEQFIVNLITPFLCMFKVCFKKLKNYFLHLKIDKNKIKIFCDKQSFLWNEMSKFILLAQKGDMKLCHDSKKKKKEVFKVTKTKITKEALELIDIIRIIEICFEENKSDFGDFELTTLKLRSIQFEKKVN